MGFNAGRLAGDTGLANIQGKDIGNGLSLAQLTAFNNAAPVRDAQNNLALTNTQDAQTLAPLQTMDRGLATAADIGAQQNTLQNQPADQTMNRALAVQDFATKLYNNVHDQASLDQANSTFKQATGVPSPHEGEQWTPQTQASILNGLMGAKEKLTFAAQNPISPVSASFNNEFNGQPPGAANGQNNAPPTGKDALALLSPAIASQVQAIGEGRAVAPSGMMLRTPYGQAINQGLYQVYPDYDATKYAERNKVQQDFTSGKSADNVLALNTAISHLGRLSDSYDKLNNSSMPLYNSLVNSVGSALGNSNIQTNATSVDADAMAVSHELASVFRRTGMSEGEINAWQDKINSNMAPAQKKAMIDQAVGLMQGRLEALSDRYNQGFSTQKTPLEMVSPEAQATITRLQGGSATPQVNAQGWTLHKDAQGNQAYVSPDGKQFQEVQ